MGVPGRLPSFPKVPITMSSLTSFLSSGDSFTGHPMKASRIGQARVPGQAGRRVQTVPEVKVVRGNLVLPPGEGRVGRSELGSATDCVVLNGFGVRAVRSTTAAKVDWPADGDLEYACQVCLRLNR